MSLVTSGEHEGLKAAVHALLGALTLTCAVYNVCAWRRRHEPHLAVNVVAYTLLTGWEASHVWHHLRKDAG